MRTTARALVMAILLVVGIAPTHSNATGGPVTTTDHVQTPVVRNTITLHRCDAIPPGTPIQRDAGMACASKDSGIPATCVQAWGFNYDRNTVTFLGVELAASYNDAFMRLQLECTAPVSECATFVEVAVGLPPTMFGVAPGNANNCDWYETTKSVFGPLPNFGSWVDCIVFIEDYAYCGEPDLVAFG